jgi:hypothetical protein
MSMKRTWATSSGGAAREAEAEEAEFGADIETPDIL